MVAKMVTSFMFRVFFLLILLMPFIPGMGCLPPPPGEISMETTPFPSGIDIAHPGNGIAIAPKDLPCPQVIISPPSIKIIPGGLPIGYEATIHNLGNMMLTFSADAPVEGRIFTTLKYRLKNKANHTFKFTVKIKYGNREMDSKEIILAGNESREISHNIYFLESEGSSNHGPYRNLSIRIPIHCRWPEPFVENILFSACIAFWLAPT